MASLCVCVWNLAVGNKKTGRKQTGRPLLDMKFSSSDMAQFPCARCLLPSKSNGAKRKGHYCDCSVPIHIRT